MLSLSIAKISWSSASLMKSGKPNPSSTLFSFPATLDASEEVKGLSVNTGVLSFSPATGLAVPVPSPPPEAVN